MSLLERTKRARRLVLFCALGACLLALALDRAGVLGALERPEGVFEGRQELAHGVVLERVRLASPPAQLVVARIPRRGGLRLRAVLTRPASQDMATVGDAARAAGALVGINGDMHRLEGPCYATPYSTLVDDGAARVVGSPFGYACQLWLDRDGAPRIERLDLGARVERDGAPPLPVFVNLERGDALLLTRPPPGPWSHPELGGVPVDVDGDALEVRGPPVAAGGRLEGPALLAKEPTGLAPGAKLRLVSTGAAAGRVALAIGTGPPLLVGGKVAAVLATPHDAGWGMRTGRAAVGLTPTHLLLVTTVMVPRAGLALTTLAEALLALGCTDALNLDGGPSPTLWAGRPLNLDVKAGDGEVEVASALLVLPPDARAGTPLR